TFAPPQAEAPESEARRPDAAGTPAPPGVDGGAPAGAAAPSVAGASPAAARPRAESPRPVAPTPHVAEAAPRRLWLAGFVVGLLVFLIAIAAYQLRDRPEELQRRAETETPAPEPAPAGKLADRIGGARPETTPAPEPATPEPAARAPQPEAQHAAAPTQSARRAALLVEAPDAPNKFKTLLGAVVWKVENVSSGPDAPLSDAVRATIEIPEEKLEVVVTLQKNFDKGLPASHTMKIEFLGDGGALGPIQQISAPQMRREDSATGEALAGAPVKITDNTFLVGLSNGEAEAANVELLRTRGWIDVPMLLANGRIAKLTFEKGEAGDKAIAEALESWRAQQ
ncbi:hypothetical protein, partial [Methylocella sp.]|uniref:hypothetical protein n=1 Tax=Methylocella sp. TaxID=1978226 RepID=UPI003782D65D